MAQGAARAGGVLKSTGARRTSVASAAQNDRINLAKRTLREDPIKAINPRTGGTPANRLDRPENITTIAGPRLNADPKEQRAQEKANQEIESDIRYAEAELVSETIRVNNQKRAEIAEKERTIESLPKEFTYKKPISGPGFYFILLLMIAKDVLAIILKIIELVADVTIILGIVMWIIATVVDFFAFACSQLYFFLNGVSMSGKKGKIQTLGFLIELVPILGFLPTETIALIWVRIETNREARQQAIDEMNAKIDLLRLQINELQNDIGNIPPEYA